MRKAYVADRTCIFNGSMYRAGETLNFDGDEIPCDFCNGQKTVNGADCPKCKGAGREIPPHHFKRIETKDNGLQADTPPAPEDTAEISERDQVRAEIRSLDGDYDPRWGVSRLKNYLVNLKKRKGV